MRTIIAGSREGVRHQNLHDVLSDPPWEISHVITGGARGADTLGSMWADTAQINQTIHKADWDKYGKSAGYKRNLVMADDAEALIAFWDGSSKGTKHMINIALNYKLHILVVIV